MIDWFSCFSICFVYIKYILVQKQFVSLQLFPVIMYWVSLCMISIWLWLSVWHQYLPLLMLSHFLGYIYNTQNTTQKIRHEKYNMKNNSDPNPNHFSSIFFYQWWNDLSPLKKYNNKISIRIKHVYLKKWCNTYTMLKYSTEFIQQLLQHAHIASKFR